MKKTNTNLTMRDLSVTQTDVRILQDKLEKLRRSREATIGSIISRKDKYKSRHLSKAISLNTKVLKAIELLQEAYPYYGSMKSKGGIYAK